MKVEDKVFEITKFNVSYATDQKHFRRELTGEEFVNAVFEPQEQVSETQAQLLEAAFVLASGGPAQTHVGTGGGGSQSDMPWGEKKVKRRVFTIYQITLLIKIIEILYVNNISMIYIF